MATHRKSTTKNISTKTKQLLKTKIGKNEKSIMMMLAEMAAHRGAAMGAGAIEFTLQFLLSGGTSKGFHHNYHTLKNYQQQKDPAKKAEIKRNYKNMLKKLEQKGYVLLGQKDSDMSVSLSPKGLEYAMGEVIAAETKATKNSKRGKWDGQWRVVMFDVTQEHVALRLQLRHLLVASGFEQIQQSVYVFPYDFPALLEFLKRNKAFGKHCHVFTGSYVGDTEKLEKKFGLDKK